MRYAAFFFLLLLFCHGCAPDERCLLYNPRAEPIFVESSDEFSAKAKGPLSEVAPHTLQAVRFNSRIVVSGKSLYYSVETPPNYAINNGKAIQYLWDNHVGFLYDYVYILGPEDGLYVAPASFKEAIDKGAPIDWIKLAQLQPTKNLPIPGYATPGEASRYSIYGNRFGLSLENGDSESVHHIVFQDAQDSPTVENLDAGSLVQLACSFEIPEALAVSWQDDHHILHHKSFNSQPIIGKTQLFWGNLDLVFTHEGLRLFVIPGGPDSKMYELSETGECSYWDSTGHH